MFWCKTISGNHFTLLCLFGCACKIWSNGKSFPLTIKYLPHIRKSFYLQTISRKFLSSLTLITHTKPKPKDGESYRRWSPDPVPTHSSASLIVPQKLIANLIMPPQTYLRWTQSDRARLRLHLAISPSPPPPPCDIASRSNPIASLSSFFSQFDQIWWIGFVGFCFFSVYLLRNNIIYLFRS